jgi:alkylation response protein AidB-like acyl-CoA dehydrogenase
MASLVLSRRDLEFLLYEWLDVTALTARERFAEHGRETFDAVLDVCEQMATELFATHNKINDQQEPHLVDGRVVLPAEIGVALQAFAGAGLLCAGLDASLGGMQLPAVIEKAGFAWFMAANVATASYPLLSMANAKLLLAHGSPEQVDRYARPILRGRFFGTMCLSEPQAGSSLGDIRTRAVADGTNWRLFGNKMWISGGEHELAENIIHLVLARIEGAAPGVKGLSLFIVPRYLLDANGNPAVANDVCLAGLNHKMGYRGTVNTLLNFGEGRFTPDGAAGARGFLVGQPGQGLACMFHMMNEARIGVGLGATALGYTAYLHALEYARTRLQGRPQGSRDPAAAQVPIVRHADVRRMLLAQKSYVEGGLALNLYCARLVDEQRTGEPEARREALLLLDLLTPVAKSWPSAWCLEANNLAIQVHGGYGYTRDFNVEQFWRDNRLNAIHEGTHGIQALDLLGRKVGMQEGAALALFVERVRRTIAAAPAVLSDQAALLTRWFDRLLEVTAVLRDAPDRQVALANASVYLDAFGHVVLAWIWLEQGRVAAAGEQSDAHFYAGKLAACRYFFSRELPKVGAMLDLLEGLDDDLIRLQDDGL